MFAQNSDAVKNSTDMDSTFYYLALTKQHRYELDKALSFLEKGIKYAQKNSSDSVYLKVLAYKSNLYGYAKKYDSALVWARQLASESKQRSNANYERIAFTKQGRYHNNRGDLVQAYSAYKNALDSYLAINDTLQTAKTYENIANIQNDLGAYFNAEETAIEALKLIDGMEGANQIWLYNALAKASKEQHQYDVAIDYYKQAIAASTSLKDRISLEQNLAVTYTKKGDYKNAENLLSGLLVKYSDSVTASTQARILDNLAYARFKLGKPESETQMLAALALREQLNSAIGQYVSYIHLSELYSDTNFEKAVRYAERAHKIAKKIKSPEARLEALGVLVELRAPASETYGVQFKQLSDSITQQRNLATTKYLKFKYEADRLKELNTQLVSKTMEHELAIEKSKNRNLILGSVLVFLLLCLGFLYKYLQQKNRRDRLKTQYETEIGLSKKVHDELANDVYHVMIQMESDKLNPEMIDRVEHIYHRTRDISKEANTINTGSGFVRALQVTLSGYTGLKTRLILKGIDEVDWQRIPSEKKKVIYRVLQELMTNMKKHSQASFVAIVFTSEGKKLKITYTDNGVGVGTSEKKQLNGLRNAENRISSIKGTFIFDTEKDTGVACEITIPV